MIPDLGTALGLLDALRRCLGKAPEFEPARKLLRQAESHLRDSLAHQPGGLFADPGEPVKPPPPEIAEALELWLSYKRERRERYGGVALKALYEMLSEMGADRATAAVKHSMANHYQGIVEPRQNGSAGKPPDIRRTAGAHQGEQVIVNYSRYEPPKP